MEMQTVCPWCESNIIWDEEIGPEKYCPHCDNEISGYRTLEIDAMVDEDEDQGRSLADDDWDDEEEQGSILRSKREIAANSSIQAMLNEQFEMPECTNCREYMLEVGEQTLGEKEGFHAKKAMTSDLPIVRNDMKVIWYVCPSCYRTDSYISIEDRKQMLDSLSSDE
ncbi:hypothetical protein [Paenibacillus camelliae]|uniref:hypothetical protein n=1 Tax=Paenibacillus camelliae TaxID=512410 RepID=UPI00203B1C5F|nr:hypothetical protein [Paenibacillus camelliae]MCM3632552.1 hypothetical protein [Paenibacillus camelliae]